jgi:Mn2+/Fe2+ NRAMP family transporter
MRWAIALMFVTIVGTAALSLPEPQALVSGMLIPRVPVGGTLLVAGVMGGVGGTLTLLSYGYWLREKGWCGSAWIATARVDLVVGYGLTGLFGLAVIVLGHSVLLPHGVKVEGATSVLQMADMLGHGLWGLGRWGGLGRWVFLVGFWGAVATSIVGVWQGVPYLFAHSWKLLRSSRRSAETSASESDDTGEEISVRGAAYRGYLLMMTFVPMVLLLIDRPVWLVVVYAALGSLFMPFLAATLLILNNRRAEVAELRNGWLINLLLVACLVLFASLGVNELASRLL